MSINRTNRSLNLILPIIGAGLILSYMACDTSCSYLRGTFMGLSVQYVGIAFMASLLVLGLLIGLSPPLNHLRTAMLSAALGGEAVLVRFQAANDVFCPYCLGFGLCLIVLFAINFRKMDKYLAGICLLAGLGAFLIFFDGSVIPSFD